MAAAATAGLSYKIRFFIAAAVMFICFIITWFSSKKPASRIQVEIQAPQQAPKGKKSSGFGKVILSIFGAYLLVLIMSSIANNGINAQISNILPNVYGIDAVTTSGLIALAGLLNIVFFIVAGLLLRKYSALSVITIGHILRLLGSVFMAILGMIAKSPILLVAASMQMLYQGTPFVRLSQPVVAVRFATFGAGSASGWVLAASAIGSFIGSLLGGFLADSVGYNAINWMAGGAAVLGTVVLIFVMWPAEKRKQKIELAESKKSS
jgi:predicted MFS family arabinose efflux permease